MKKRLIEYLNNIGPKLNQKNFDDPEKALEYLLLKQMLKILDDILKEKMLYLNEEDKKNLLGLFEKEDEKKRKQNP